MRSTCGSNKNMREQKDTKSLIFKWLNGIKDFPRRGICSDELEEDTGVIVICTRKMKMPIRQLNGSGYYSPTCI